MRLIARNSNNLAQSLRYLGSHGNQLFNRLSLMYLLYRCVYMSSLIIVLYSQVLSMNIYPFVTVPFNGFAK